MLREITGTQYKDALAKADDYTIQQYLAQPNIQPKDDDIKWLKNAIKKAPKTNIANCIRRLLALPMNPTCLADTLAACHKANKLDAELIIVCVQQHRALLAHDIIRLFLAEYGGSWQALLVQPYNVNELAWLAFWSYGIPTQDKLLQELMASTADNIWDIPLPIPQQKHDDTATLLYWYILRINEQDELLDKLIAYYPADERKALVFFNLAITLKDSGLVENFQDKFPGLVTAGSVHDEATSQLMRCWETQLEQDIIHKIDGALDSSRNEDLAWSELDTEEFSLDTVEWHIHIIKNMALTYHLIPSHAMQMLWYDLLQKANQVKRQHADVPHHAIKKTYEVIKQLIALQSIYLRLITQVQTLPESLRCFAPQIESIYRTRMLCLLEKFSANLNLVNQLMPSGYDEKTGISDDSVGSNDDVSDSDDALDDDTMQADEGFSQELTPGHANLTQLTAHTDNYTSYPISASQPLVSQQPSQPDPLLAETKQRFADALIATRTISYKVFIDVIKPFYYLLGHEETALTIRHRQHSGFKQTMWDTAADSNRFIAVSRTDGGIAFHSLPLANDNSAIALALLTSLFYHRSKQAWDSEVAMELRQLLAVVVPSLPLTMAESVYYDRYQQLEQQLGYFAECPSDDSDNENCRGFSKKSIRERNALLQSSSQMTIYAQVDAIWLKDKKGLRKPATYTGNDPTHVSYYECTERATIHHQPEPNANVQRDLILLNHLYREGQLNAERLKEIETKFFVAQYRGIHYDTSRWSQAMRRQHRKQAEAGQTFYAEAVFKQAGFNFWEVTTPTTAQCTAMQEAAILLQHQIDALHHTGVIHSSLHREDGEKDTYRDAVMALQDFYTKHYIRHRQQCDKVYQHKTQGTPIRTAIDAALLFAVGAENCYLSTGDTPYHPLRYAAGLKSYADSKDQRLRPRWRNDGQVERPYSGAVYTFLLEPLTYAQLNPRHLISLNYTKELSVHSQILAERETTFVVQLPADTHIEKTIVRYPSFAHGYSDYYQHRYGMDEALYNAFKQQLLQESPSIPCKPHSKQNKETKFLLGEHLCAYHEACLIEDARLEARRKGGWLIYRDFFGEFAFVPPKINPETRGDRADAGAAQRRRQANLLQQRREQPVGILAQIMQSYNIIPGRDFAEVLERMLSSAINISKIPVAESTSQLWFSHFKPDVLHSMPEIVKQRFILRLASLWQLAQDRDLHITIRSFLFVEGQVLLIKTNQDTDQTPQLLELIYLGGDGFYGLSKKGPHSPEPVPIAVPAPQPNTKRNLEESSTGSSKRSKRVKSTQPTIERWTRTGGAHTSPSTIAPHAALYRPTPSLHAASDTLQAVSGSNSDIAVTRHLGL